MRGPAFDDRYDARFRRGYVASGPDASGGVTAERGTNTDRTGTDRTGADLPR